MVINYCNQKKLDKEFMNDTFFGWLGKSVLGRFVLLFTAFPIVILTILFAFLVLIFKEKK